MSRDFSQLFEIIRNKFIQGQAGKPITMKAFAQFLGHEHDGKINAWRKGQWPSAEDIAILHDKLGFNYRWLLTGEGTPRENRQTDTQFFKTELEEIYLMNDENEKKQVAAPVGDSFPYGAAHGAQLALSYNSRLMGYATFYRTMEDAFYRFSKSLAEAYGPGGHLTHINEFAEIYAAPDGDRSTQQSDTCSIHTKLTSPHRLEADFSLGGEIYIPIGGATLTLPFNFYLSEPDVYKIHINCANKDYFYYDDVNASREEVTDALKAMHNGLNEKNMAGIISCFSLLFPPEIPSNLKYLMEKSINKSLI